MASLMSLSFRISSGMAFKARAGRRGWATRKHISNTTRTHSQEAPHTLYCARVLNVRIRVCGLLAALVRRLSPYKSPLWLPGHSRWLFCESRIQVWPKNCGEAVFFHGGGGGAFRRGGVEGTKCSVGLRP